MLDKKIVTPEDIEAEHKAALASLTPEQRRALDRRWPTPANAPISAAASAGKPEGDLRRRGRSALAGTPSRLIRRPSADPGAGASPAATHLRPSPAWRGSRFGP